MKLNFRPSKVAFIDFETQSVQDISLGAKKYAEHPSTRVLTCCYKREGGPIVRMGPYLDAEAKQHLANLAAEHTLVAHNAPFDAAVWEAAGLPEASWFDTLPCARAAGYPGALDKLGKALGLGGKDRNGERLISMLCILRPGKPAPAVGPAHELLIDYNVRDVELLEMVYGRVKGFGEPDVMAVDRAVNDRGLSVDVPLLYKLKELFEENARRNSEEIAAIGGALNVRSHKQMVEFLAGRGVAMDGVSKVAVNAFLEDPSKYFVGDSEEEAGLSVVQELLELRREVVGVGAGKVQNAIDVLDADGRLRDLLIYFGGHTGRWTSRKLQLHNMPANVLGMLDVRDLEPSYEAVLKHTMECCEQSGQRVAVSDVLNLMLRRIVSFPNLLVGDWNAVEARCLAWMAGEQSMMAVFNDPKGKSLYLDLGKEVFRRPISKDDDPAEYALAKSVVLGCGYGMSGAKFERMMNLRLDRATLAKLKAANLDLRAAVKLYRDTYPGVTALWKEFGKAVIGCVERGEEWKVGKCLFTKAGSDMHVILPSGRPFVYRNVRVEMLVPAYCAIYGMPEVPVPTVVFDKPAGKGFLYGSKVCENVDQAICRDILAEKVVASEQLGLTPVMHVHDEVVNASGPERQGEFMRMMSEPPPWAPGFPLLVEGYSGAQWTKSPKGYKQMKAFNGRVL